jgi:hypothetical protein
VYPAAMAAAGHLVEDLKTAPHVPTRSPAECAQHMEECPNGLAFFKRYAEGSTEKKVRVLTYLSSYRLSHFLAMYTQDHLALPLPREDNTTCTRRNPTSAPCAFRRSPPIRQSAITSGSSSDFILHFLITRVLSS